MIYYTKRCILWLWSWSLISKAQLLDSWREPLGSTRQLGNKSLAKSASWCSDVHATNLDPLNIHLNVQRLYSQWGVLNACSNILAACCAGEKEEKVQVLGHLSLCRASTPSLNSPEKPGMFIFQYYISILRTMVEWGNDKMGMTNYISNGKSPISARTNPRSLVMVPVGYWAGDGINHRALQV